MNIQNQVLFLSMHCPGILSEMLEKAPELLATPKARLLRNIQLLAQHTESLEQFTELLRTQPWQLRRKNLAAELGSYLSQLQQAFPTNIIVEEILHAQPRLFAVPTRRILKGWQKVEAACAVVDVWQEELKDLLSQVGSFQDADGGEVVKEQESPDTASGDEEQPPEEAKSSYVELTPAQLLGDLLLDAPIRHWRLKYLISMFSEGDGVVINDELPGLLDVMLAQDEEFFNQFPDFVEWSEQDKLQQRRARRERLLQQQH